MKDSWCTKLCLEDGRDLYGGAARNVRIARAGGMENIIRAAVKYALEMADAAVEGKRKAKVSRFRTAA